MVKHYEIVVASKDDYHVSFLGEMVKEKVKESGIKNGIVTTVTAHTNTGVVVTEPLDCIISDMNDMLHELVKDDAQYAHAHFLPTYGRTSANATGHLRSILMGNSCIFPIHKGQMMMGEAQEILLVEYDGPQARKVYIDIIGE